MESRDHALMIAEKLKKLSDNLDVNIIYKSSFDKANRTSISSDRGIGLDKALPIFDEIRKTFNMACLTDVHSPDQASTRIRGELIYCKFQHFFVDKQIYLLQLLKQVKS